MNTSKLLGKLTHHSGRVYKGYLQPQEALVLKNAGCSFSKDDITWMDERIKVGNSQPKWVFFSLNQVMYQALKGLGK